MVKKSNWTLEDDERLVYFFQKGYYAREIARKLNRTKGAVDKRIQKFKQDGRIRRRVENREIKREVREQLNNISKIEVSKEKLKNENFENEVIEVVEQEVVIETAYQMMEEAGGEKGSTVFRQTIESLYAKTDKELIHKKGLASYIKKVIHNKIGLMSIFWTNSYT